MCNNMQTKFNRQFMNYFFDVIGGFCFISRFWRFGEQSWQRINMSLLSLHFVSVAGVARSLRPNSVS